MLGQVASNSERLDHVVRPTWHFILVKEGRITPVDYFLSALTDISPTQAKVAAICTAILGLGQIALDDDIYELGGDSQQAVLIALRIEATLPVQLPLEAI